LTGAGVAGETGTAVAADSVEPLYGISRAASECGVSERALRYYEEIGLLAPAGKTPGGLRRYSQSDLARVRRIRELQSVVGLNLDEIRTILDSDDRLNSIRDEYRASGTRAERRRELLSEGLALREQMAASLDGKLERLLAFRADVGAAIERIQELLRSDDVSPT
jgi:MerR family transcriptional regulator, repressor of the yfmOP operon